MISYLAGTIIGTSKDRIVVQTAGGVGYDVLVTGLQITKFHEGQTVCIHTYLRVTDSALDLFGFETLAEKSFFTLLLTVSGIGPKGAMNILSLGSIDEIQAAIARGDVTYLTSVQGMGKKTAERVVVELKSKIGMGFGKGVGEEVYSGSIGEAVEALISMGYSAGESREAVKGSDATLGVEKILKQALKKLM